MQFDNRMPTVYVNNEPIELGADERLNCIQAAQRVGVEIPHYCWHPALSVVASCRMCLVEIGAEEAGRQVAMQPKLVPGCQTPVKDGTVIVADSEKVKAAQKATLEYLLLDHPLDCPTCDQAGECFLQDYSYKYGRGYSRLQEPKKHQAGQGLHRRADHAVHRSLHHVHAAACGSRARSAARRSCRSSTAATTRRSTSFPGEPCNNKLAGNVVDLCPVGALCSKDFLYKQRVWWLKTANSVCPNCSTGCSIHVDQNEDRVYRLRPRANPQAQGHFMCDEGRFGWKYMHSDERLTLPEQRSERQSRVARLGRRAAGACERRSSKRGASGDKASRPCCRRG